MAASTSSGLNVAARLSPPLSISRSSSPGNRFWRSWTASRFAEASSRIAVCGQPPVSTPTTRSAGSAPLDAGPHPAQNPLALELAERDQPEPRADQQRHGRVEVRGRRALGLDAAAPDGRAEDRRVMAGRPRLVDGAHEPREERVGAEAGGDPQGLATHLAAGRPEL